MSFFLRIYFNAVFGALGGLMGWLLFGVFGDKSSSTIGQQLLGGACIGGFIGYFIVGVDAIRDGSLLRFGRLASIGVLLGGAGGALGMWWGEVVHDSLMQGLTNWNEGFKATLSRIFEVLSRGLGWGLLGLAVGFSEGVASRSLGKMSYGMLGGAIGGFLGGVLFGLIKTLEKGSEGSMHVLGGVVGLVILGACIGALSALVQSVFQPASIRVLRGWQEGREYSLLKASTLVGRDEAADIALFRDMKVEKKHASIQRSGNRFILFHQAGPASPTRVNDEPVAQFRPLGDGDRIQMGNIVLRFQLRAAKQKEVSGKVDSGKNVSGK